MTSTPVRWERARRHRWSSGAHGTRVTASTSWTSTVILDSPHPTQQPLLAALAGLLFTSVPLASAVGPTIGDAAAAGAFAFALIPILTRLKQVPWLAMSTSALVGVYLIGASFFSVQHAAQGLRHTLTTATACAALLLFSCYGEDIVAYSLYRICSHALIGAGVLGVLYANLEKNATGGTIVYLAALLAIVLVSQKPGNATFYALLLFAVTGALSVVFDFRALVAFTVIMLISYWGAAALSRKVFWLVGIAGSVAFIGGTTWYYLHVFTSPLARHISQIILAKTGRPATSGRQLLWPAIVHAVGDNKWHGLGVGVLPRDILLTNLSSHSTFMQTYLQLGYLGLALIALVLLSVWKRLAASTNAAGRFGAAVFLTFVVHNSTEVLMFENRLIAAIPAWCAIGLAYSLSRAGQDDDPGSARVPEVSSAVTTNSDTWDGWDRRSKWNGAT